jgi:hypothetical protein
VSEYDDMAAFMEERLDEEEAAAEAASSGHPNPESRGGTWQVVGDRHIRYDNGCGETVTAVDVTGGPCMWHEQVWVKNDSGHAVSAHIARHDPARVLAGVKAKRAVLSEWAALSGLLEGQAMRGQPVDKVMAFQVRVLEGVIRKLCAEWAGHPGCKPEWASA